jgi:AbrB family looped-hinge helix DNA binding protein
MKAVKVGKRGTIIVPAKLRKRYGIEEGRLVTAEARGDGVLIRPVVVLPVERYTPERKAEFLLSSRLPEELAVVNSLRPVATARLFLNMQWAGRHEPECRTRTRSRLLFSHGFRPRGANRDITPHSSSSFERALIGSTPRC